MHVPVQEMFRQAALRFADRPAIEWEGCQTSYRQLESQVVRLAQGLRGAGAERGSLIAIMADRTADVIAAMLAVLEAGCAFVPIDLRFPAATLPAVVAEASPRLWLVSEGQIETLEGLRREHGFDATILPIAESWVGEAAEGLRLTPPAEPGDPDALSYVYFTSGSTGRPKGIAGRLQAIDHFIRWEMETFGVVEGTRVSQLTSPAFDAFLRDVFTPLAAGGTVCVPAGREVILDGRRLVGWIESQRVEILHCTPSLFRLILGQELTPASFPALRWVLLAGEPLLPSDVRRWYGVFAERIRLVNLYGPSETTMIKLFHLVLPEDGQARTVPIGRPMPGARAIVVDEKGRPCPPGKLGEIYIRTQFRSLGYLNRPDLTAESFIQNPFSDRPGDIVYKTGDLGRLREDGTFEFVGRRDTQVKVRGVRVEIAPIEDLLRAQPGVADAAVADRTDTQGNKFLCAYVVPQGEVDPATLAEALRGALPESAVPSVFVLLEALPRTLSGKVDRRSLPNPGESGREHVPPRTPVEETLCGIFSELLGIPQVGIRDHFFELGGHSLLATMLLSRIRSAFGVEVPLRDVFRAPTPEGLALTVVRLRVEQENEHEEERIAARAGSGPAPLSYAQQRLWFIAQLEPGSPLYNIPVVLGVEGPLRFEVLRLTLGEIVRRHEALRTVFSAPEGSPVQVIQPAAPFALPVVDLSGLPESRRETAASALAGEEAGRPFDLGDPRGGPLLRCLLLRLAPPGEPVDHVLALTMHHIASDGWSMGILVREVAALYAALSSEDTEGRRSPLPELPVQYADFAVWQSSWLQGEALESELAYWRQQLAGLPALLSLPTDRPRPAVQSYRGATRPLRLPAGLTGKMKALALREGATLFMVLLAGLETLLARSSGQDDLAVGSPVAGRNRKEIEGLIGFFVNTLVLRGDLSGEPSVSELLVRARETALAAYVHQDVPFEKLVQELAPERSLAHSPLFQVMLVLHNAPAESLEVRDLRLRPLSLEATTSKFDLTLNLEEHQEDLLGAVEYATHLFDAATIDRLMARYERLLAGMVEDPERGVHDLDLLTAEETLQLRAWNQTAVAYHFGRPLHAWIEDQVDRTPDAVAVSFEGEELSYGELDRRANGLARRLRALSVGPESRVAVCLERSAELVIAVLAVFKAGGAYVPLDPEYPRERLAFLLADAQPAVLVSSAALLDRLPAPEVPLVQIDQEAVEGGGRLPESCVSDLQLAYVIYTSGSTGRPKGVAVPHRALVNFLFSLRGLLGIGPGDRLLAVTSLSFDIAALELYLPLLAGAAVEPVGRETAMDGERLREWLEASRPTFLQATPSTWRMLVRSGWEGSPDLTVLCGGEPLPEDLARDLTARAHAVWNLYGPTETTVWSSADRLPGPAPEPPRVTLGRPIANTAIHLLDRQLAPVPVGVPGELYIGGDGVTRGYPRRPELTAERFLPDPFATDRPGLRLYRTGDLARRLPDGRVEFLGRVDHQVKLRGFRIEPGEIEAALVALDGVREAVVAAREDRLVAYVVADVVNHPGIPGLAAAELRRSLRERLPDYMVPSAFVALAALPLTPNGKVDRKALPAPERRSSPSSPETGLAPRTPVEEILAGIWAEVLGRERVGASDHFFDLGGHSLLATQVMSRLRRAFGIEMPLRDLFATPRLADLAVRVEAALAAGTPQAAPPLVRIAPALRQGPLPLSFAQQRLWFIDQLEPGSALYNMPVALRVEGPLRTAVLRLVLGEVVRRHEALRTVFAVSEGREGSPVQVVQPAAPFELPVVDLSGLPETAREALAAILAGEEGRRPFDLGNLTGDPLLRGLLLRLAPPGEPADHAVLLTMHHIASDGWSMGILVREVAALYTELAAGRPSPLPELPVQYADFAVWQSSWLCGEVLENEVSFWRRELAGLPPLLALPTDRPRPAVQSFRGASWPVRLPSELTRQAQALARREGATLFMVLLTGFQALLSRYSGQEDLAVGSPVAGRNRPEIEGLIGFFVNMLVLRGDLSGDQRGEPSFRGLLGRTRETALAALAHQDLPFERLVEELAPERSLAHSPLFQAVLVLQNAPFENLEVDESLRLRPMSAAGSGGTARFDLTVSLEEHEGVLAGAVEHATDLFDLTTIRRLVDGFERLLAGALADPDRPLTDLPLLSEAELHQSRIEWNPVPQTAGRFREGETLAAVFEDQVDRAPDRLALLSGDLLTFGELDVRANRLAHHLRAAGAGPEVPVALCLDRSSEAVVAILAVWKAGAYYVPLDPAQPAGRLAFLLEDLLEDRAAPLLVSRSRFAASLPAAGRLAGLRTVWLDEEASAIAQRPAERPAGGAGPGNLAYAIYTSGSTGRPKGVQVEHRPALHLLAALEAAVLTPLAESGLHPGPLLASLNAPLIFDASVQQLVLLLAGHALCIVPEDIRADGAALLGFLQARGVDLLDCTPSHLRLLVDAGLLDSVTGPRIVLTAGEAVDESLWRRLAEAEGKVVFNLYGPTECTVDATWHRIERIDRIERINRIGRGSGQPTIGRPLPGYEVFLLGRGLQPVPPGAPGEICLGGAGLARGYLRRPELTAERFVPHPFARTEGERLYRTGDLGRHFASGHLEFLGRLDHQVKIRGFRIELGEIEAALVALPEVREAVVVVREERFGGAAGGAAGDRRLVAYVTGDASADALRRSLRERLPDYMVPSSFVMLAALPLTASGKVDRKSLPDPQHSERDYLAPRTPVEEVLAGIWAEVLGLERVGAADSFFELGGHSLLATQVMSRLRSAFGVEMPLRDLFATPRLADLAVQVETALSAGTAQAALPLVRIAPALRQEPQPLSFAQQRLWFLDRLAPGNPFYNIFSAARLTGELDVDALRRAFAETVRRHEVLRTVFWVAADRPMQVIVPAAEVEVPVIDLEGIAGELRRAERARLTSEESLRPFDLDRYPLFRAQLIRLGEREHELLVSLHHIISDGWSMGILLRELATLYGAFSGGAPSPLPELPVQYADFAAWQRQQLQGERLETELDYWRRQLAGIPEALELPYDHPRPVVESFRGGTRSFALPPALVRELTALTRRQGATLSMTLLAGFKALLARTSGSEDLALGVAIANRTRHEIEGLIGFFVNTLVFRTDLGGAPGFARLVARVRETALAAYTHQDLPFERLVEELQPERDLSRNPLVQVMYGFQNFPRAGAEVRGLVLSPPEDTGLTARTAKFDLTLFLFEEGGLLWGSLEYNRDLFEETTIQRLLAHFERLLAAAVAQPETAVALLPLLSEGERHQLAREWNDTGTSYPAGASLQELFEEQVRKAPGAVAVIHGARSLSYAELDRHANRLAHRLRGLGVGPGSRVGLCLERSPEMVVGLLGIVKAGGAYVPLDPDYPDERLAFMVEDSGLRALVGEESALARLTGRLAGGDGLILVNGGLDADLDPKPGPADDLPVPPRSAGGDSLAYVMYTSGSTGRPKGVAVPHRAVVRLVRDTNYMHLRPGDRVAQLSTLNFDAATWEIWGPLLNGAAVVVVPRDAALSPRELAALPREQGITSFLLTTALFNKVAQEMPEAFQELRDLLTGGEAASPAAMRAVLAAGPPRRLLHVYGPTESTTCASWHPVLAVPPRAVTVPIGAPLANTSLFVLDRRCSLVPPGVAGELFLGGDGLAWGYWGRPDLTAERFVPHPLGTGGETGGRLYRTGDLVRQRSDGAVEFLGRVDQQVKIRGFRIEPGEIEARLAEHPAVLQSYVLAREDVPGDRRLVAYVVEDPAWEARESGAQTEQVSQWGEIFDDMYRDEAVDADPTFNTIGWDSTYTGLPLPRTEMEEWLEDTVGRIAALAPRQVLEIGCGTGMILFRIAPGCERYTGLDVSGRALRYIESQLGPAGLDRSRIELRQGSAEQLGDLAPGSFDTVVVNSVAQYFPSADYLAEVLARAADAVRPGGSIFLGDLRSLPLLAAFHASLELFAAASETPLAELRQKVQARRRLENELVIDPAFFAALRRRLPRLGRVEVHPKRGVAHNELTAFRYQVVLRLDEAGPAAEVSWLDWRREGLTLEALRRRLEGAPAVLGLRNVPNARSAEAGAAARLLAREESGTAGDLRRLAAEAAAGAVEPQEIWDLARELPYEVELGWASPGDSGCFDAVLRRRGGGGGRLAALLPEPRAAAVSEMRPEPEPLGLYTNHPLQGRFARRVAPELSAFLQARLPDYMVPSAFVLLDALPLNANGKVDRRRLPAPDAGRLESGRPLVAPRNATEERLVGIWRDLLGVERIGVEDDFFALGGHSLLATQAVSRVREAFGVELPLRTFFESPTAAAVAALVDLHREGGEAMPPMPPILPIPPESRDGRLPLSFAQERLWFLHHLDTRLLAYNESAGFRLEGRLEEAALRWSLDEMLRRHEALRTVFPEAEGFVVQRILPAAPFAILSVDLRALPGELREREARRLAAAQMRRRFDLAAGPLVHGLLARLDDRDHAAVFFFHHIVFDGWSMAVFAREFSLLYAARCAGRPSPLPPLPVQYADFAVWQRDWLRGEVFERQLAYWRERLAGIAVLDLPTDRPRPAVPASPGDWLPFHLPPALTESLRAFSRDRGHTLFMTLLAAFQALLHRYTGQLEVTVGTPIANRHRGELENLIGFFVNMIVLRLDLSGDPSFAALAAQAHGVALGAYEHQDMPFDKLVFELQPERDLRYTPLFQVGFQLLKVPDARLDLPGLAVSPFASEARFAKFDLNLGMSEEADHLPGVLDYDTDLFDRSTALRLLSHFEALLEAVAAAPSIALSAVPLLRGWERHQLLVEWSGGPELQTPPDATLPALFARQAARTPEAPALLWQGDVWTFRELAGRAGRLARHLCALGIGPETRVGVCAERGPDLVCALLGVLEAGAAYVPLDPAWPQQRLATLIEDARAPFLLLSAGLAGRIQAGAARTLVLEDLLREAPPEVSGGMKPLPENLAYVIYTSGSTGHPKGVAVRHSSVSALLRWASGAFNEDERRRIVAGTSVCFDLSVFELFLPLTTGGTVVLAGNPLDIARRAAETEATLVNTVPSILSEVLRSGPLPASVSTVALAGEPLPAALAAALHRAGTVRRVVNLYGPSEDTTYSTIDEIGPGEAGPPPIGRPIDGTRAYVLDAGLRPVLPGVPGELCLAGEGLARGYLHQPERTAESFLPDPFAAAPGSRMYRTGDLARFRSDGRLEYLGRLDHQVKIRGVRLELGEIEATLATLPGVREAVVVVREDVPGDRRLVAYVTGDAVADAPVDASVETLRRSLRERLPDAMVPSAFVTLAALPLTPTGKLDRKALLSPGAAPGQQGSEKIYVAPRTPVEESLAGIWTELLGRERVGAADHFFFDLGGHSLLAVRLMARIEQSLGVKLPLAALFEAPTVERLAEVVQRKWAPDDRSPLVRLHPGGAGRPLFLAHPVGGDVFAYLELARRLGADRPVYGLQAISEGSSEGNGHQPRTMEELAAQYLAAVREVQAEGPYLLAGWSLGAVIAYEMAQQIESSGGTVGLLAMLDPSDPPSPAAEHSGFDDTALLAGFAADLVRLSGRPVAFGPEVLAGLDVEAGLDRVLELGRGEGVLPPEIDRARLCERFERFSRHLRALYGYAPHPYGGRVALFRASASLRPEGEGAAPGWSALARAEIHLFQADHYTLLQSPALDGLVEQLKADLRVEDEPRH